MKLSRTLTYAVQALVELAEIGDGEPVSCRRLAETGQMPKRFLLQILRALVTHDILRSTRGVEGGYKLTRPADQITLLEVVEAIDGPVALDLPGLSDVRPEVRESLGQLNVALRENLAKFKLSQLVTPARPTSATTAPVVSRRAAPLPTVELGSSAELIGA